MCGDLLKLQTHHSGGQHPPDLVELGVVSIAAGAIGQPVAWLFKPDEPGPSRLGIGQIS